jgi:hypothetical protein
MAAFNVEFIYLFEKFQVLGIALSHNLYSLFLGPLQRRGWVKG